MSEYISNETEIDYASDELKEKLEIIKDLKNQIGILTKGMEKLKHNSEISINDLNIQLEVLQKKNKSLNEYNEAIKNTNNYKIDSNNDFGKQLSKLENYISDLESEKNLILNSKMNLERQNHDLMIENSNLKLENNKLTVSKTKYKSLASQDSKDKDLLEKNTYEMYSEEIIELLLDKDLTIQNWESKFDDFERQAIELITEECNKHFIELKTLQESNTNFSEKLRETQNELLAKIKEYEDLEKDVKENSKINLKNKNNSEIYNLNNELNHNKKEKKILSFLNPISISCSDNLGNNCYDAQSFDSEEVQVLVENYKEIEGKYRDLENEYGQKRMFWEFEMERLKNQFNDSESILKNKIDDISKSNEFLRKEIIDFENQQLKNNYNNKQTDNILLLEIDNLKTIIDEMNEQREKIENNYYEKIQIINKELREADIARNALLISKEQLNKDLNNFKSASLIKEKEIQEKNKIEINYKEKEIKESKIIIESLNKEIEINKKDLNIFKNNYDKLNCSYENLNKNYEKISKNNKNEIERLKDEKDKYKNIRDFQVQQLKNQINELKEKITEKETFIAINITNSTEFSNVVSLSDVLSENESEKIQNLKSEIEKKEQTIKELNYKIEEYKTKISENDNLHTELNDCKAEILQHKNNLKSQKDIYEKQINELQKNFININADLLSQRRRTTSLKIETSFNSKQLVVFAEMDSNIKELISENIYLKEQLEITKVEFEKIKDLRENDIKYLKQELLESEKSTIEAKISVATLAFDKDCEIIKYKNMYKKLRTKMSQLKA